MNADKLKLIDPDYYELADTVVQDENAVMDTSEFRRLLNVDSDVSEDAPRLADD